MNHQSMDINFVFTTVVALNFVVKFEITPEHFQDYFLFSGTDSIAHLYRENATTYLFLKHDSSQQLFTFDNASTPLTFAWDRKTINNKPMNVHSNQSLLNHFNFDAYTFLSPIMEIQQLNYLPSTECQCGETNYELIALIMFAIGLGFKFDVIAPKIFDMILKKTKRLEEDEYMEMNTVV